MKRMLLLLLVALAVGCNKKPDCDCCDKEKNEDPKKTTKVAIDDAPNCDELTGLTSRSDILHYIETHREELCDGTLDECVLKVHKVSFDKFYEMIRDYWGTNKPKYKSFTWGDIKEKMEEKCYPNYLGFVISNDGQITALDPITAFPPENNMKPCYSYPLFRAIDKKFGGLKDTDEIVFVVAKENGDQKVIFYFEDKATGNTAFYNISDNPTKEL